MEASHVWILFYESGIVSVLQQKQDGTFDVYNAVDGTVPTKIIKLFLSETSVPLWTAQRS